MTYMRVMWKTTGLCLAVMFAVGMTLAGTAQAKWEECSEGGSATKYSEHQCSKAEGTGKWQWNEVTGTEEVRIKGSLRLTDTKVPIIGRVSIECAFEGVGHAGPGEHGRINEIKTSAEKCRDIENCEKVEKVEARDLPWQAEGANVEEAALKGTGSGEPGWKIKCKVSGLSSEDECTSGTENPENVLLENRNTGGESSVLATLLESAKAKCSVGGAEAGEESGNLSISKVSGGLRVGPVGNKIRFGWRVKGNELTSTESRAINKKTISLESNLTITGTANRQSFRITCNTVKEDVGAARIYGGIPGRVTLPIKFEGCTVSPTGCTVAEPIELDASGVIGEGVGNSMGDSVIVFSISSNLRLAFGNVAACGGVQNRGVESEGAVLAGILYEETTIQHLQFEPLTYQGYRNSSDDRRGAGLRVKGEENNMIRLIGTLSMELMPSENFGPI